MTFDDAVREYAPMLRRRALALEQRDYAPEADDLMQETLFEVWRQWEWVTLVGDAMVKHRMFRILGQQCVMAMRRAAPWLKRGRPAPNFEISGLDLPVVADQADAFDLKRAAEMIEEMRPQRSTAIAMHAVGYDRTEIGKALGGISRQAVDQHINYARKELEGKKR